MSDEVAEAVIGDERPQSPFRDDSRDQGEEGARDPENHSECHRLLLSKPPSRQPDERARQNNRVETLARDPQKREVPC